MKRHSRTWLFLITIVLISISFFPIGEVAGQNEPPIYFPYISVYQNPYYAFGLDGGTVENVIVDPENSDIVYAGTWGNGIYKSLDGGETWDIHITDELRSAYIYEIAIDPLNSNHLLASVYEHGIDQSFDGGMTWEPTSGFPVYSVAYSIDFDSSVQLEDPHVRSSTVYAAIREQTIYQSSGNIYPGGVWKSFDGGDNWQQVTLIENGFYEEDYIYDLAIDPNDPQTIYTANHRTGVYKTTDGGANWVKMSRGLIHEDIRGIQVNPINGQIYAGIWDGYGFAFSDNGGFTWVNNIYTHSLGLYVYEVQYDPHQPNNVYLTTASGVYFCKKPTAYSTCSLVANKGKFVFDLALDLNAPAASNGQTKFMYTGVQHFGLFKSNDGGVEFDPSYRGIRANIVRAITIDPINPDIQYVSASYRGLYKSVDAGNSWKSLHYALDLEYINDISINPDTPDTIYVGDKYGGIYYSLDGGESWQPGNSGIARSVSPDEDEIEVDVPEGWIDEDDYKWMDPVDLQDLLDAVGSSSADRGTLLPITTIGFAPNDRSRMFAGTNGGGVLYTNNGGLSWSTSSLKSGFVMDSLVDPNQNEEFLIGIADYGLKVSSDRYNWRDMRDGLPAWIDVIALEIQGDGEYLAGTGEGVYRLDKSIGETWIKLGLDTEIHDLVVDPVNSQMIWAVTWEGLYYGRPTGVDDAYEWIKLDLVGSNNEHMQVIEVIPGVHEFYIGMDGGDIYHLTEDLLP